MTAYTKDHNRIRTLFLLSALMALFFVAQDASGQFNHNTTRSNKTAPAALDVDSDNDGVAVAGTLHVSTDDTARLSLYQDGEDRVLRKRPGRTSYGDITLKKGYVKHCISDGSLEHTDDWIAARAASTGDAGSGMVITLVSVSGQDEADEVLACSRGDVHSGKLTGVRQHRPVRVKEIDAATPYIYKALLGNDGSFSFENVEPANYLVVATVDGNQGYVGHVTVLK